MPKKGRKGVDQRVKGNVKVSTPPDLVCFEKSVMPRSLGPSLPNYVSYQILSKATCLFVYKFWIHPVNAACRSDSEFDELLFFMRSWVGAPYTMVYNIDCVTLKFCFWLAVFAVFPLILLRSTHVFWKVATRCCTLWETPWLFCLQMVLYYKTPIEQLMDAFMCVP